MNPQGENGRNNSTSLRRALGILLHLQESGGPRGRTLAELAGDLGMSKSTLLRLLAPLCDTRLVEQDPDTGRYRLGWRTAALGETYLERLDLREVAHPTLRDVSGRSGETSHLVIPDFPEVVYVDKVDSSQPVRMYSRIGSRQPAYCTGVGKALLAHAGQEAFRAVVAAGMAPRTQNTRTTEEALAADLAVVRERGYAVDEVENEQDIRCVAAPVFDRTGAAVCALSVSGPSTRVTMVRVPELAGLVTESATEISRKLGAH